MKPERIDGDGYFEHQGVLTAQIVKVDGQHRFWLKAMQGDSTLLAHEIKSSMNEKWSSKMTSVTWNEVDEEDMTSWLFRFASTDDYGTFLQYFTIAAWETKFQMPWSKAKVGAMHYLGYLKAHSC